VRSASELARSLQGDRVVLRPIAPAADAVPLFEAGRDPAIWAYLPYGPYASAGEMQAALEENASSDDPIFYVVEVDGTPLGIVSYLRVEPRHRVVEIGHIWFGTPLQRTAAATETIYLLARHAFDDLGNRRFEWKCDAANARSRRAAERFGFTFEGVFRQHQIVKGRNRDTAWYAMLDGEWPAMRAAFEGWLAPENFDAGGRQRRSLEQLRQS
jgi:RimJ/RimL family protein N-acetyltransferase